MCSKAAICNACGFIQTSGIVELLDGTYAYDIHIARPIEQKKNGETKMKTSVEFSEGSMRHLQKLADDNSLSILEFISRAIKAEQFIIDQQKKGRKILVEDKDGKLLEVRNI